MLRRGGPIRFGVFELDLAAAELRRNGARVKLQEQPFQVLAALLERPREIVTKEELQERIWKDDTFVDFDRSLATAVNKVRQALGDSATNSRFVETVPRRGYRFIYPLEGVGEASATHAKPQRSFPWPILLPAVIGAFVVGWLLRSSPGPEPPAAPIVAEPLTAYPGRELFPSFSPDGDRIAFAWESENRMRMDIYVKLIGEDTPQRLTGHPALEDAPAWSPDGRQIAFVRHERNTSRVIVISSIGGPEREVVKGSSLRGMGAWNSRSRCVAWHPDSEHLVLSHISDVGSPAHIYVVSLETGELKRLITADATDFGHTDPAVSPDGRQLAFRTKYTHGSAGVFVVRLTESLEIAGEPRKLTGGMNAYSPAWTGDSREIVFAAGPPERSRLWRVSADGGEPRPITQPSEGAYPALSPTGNRSAFVRGSYGVNIWEARIPGGEEGTPLISSSYFDRYPCHSPDGGRITFSSSRSGFPEIWACDRDGSQPVQLTFLESVYTTRPRWSPDGTRIAFLSVVEGQRDIFVVPASGGRPERMTDHPSQDSYPTWSRDSQWIYFSSGRSGKESIWKIPVEGGDAMPVTGAHGQIAAESPDGKTLYYIGGGPAATRPTPGSLWSIPVEGGTGTSVLDGVAPQFMKVTGDKIYIKLRAYPWLSSYDFRSGTVEPLLDSKTASPGGVGFSVAPDNHSMLYTRVSHYESDIMQLENFR